METSDQIIYINKSENYNVSQHWAIYFFLSNPGPLCDIYGENVYHGERIARF